MKINIRYMIIPVALVCIFFVGTVNAVERNIIAEMRLEKNAFRPDEPIKVNVLVKNMGAVSLPLTFQDGQYVGPRMDYGAYLFSLENNSEISSNHGPLDFHHIYLTGVPAHSEISLLRFDTQQFMGISSPLSPGEYILFISFSWRMEDNTYERLYAESYFTIGEYNDTETILNAINDASQKLISIEKATSVIKSQVGTVKSLLSTVYALEQKIYTYAVKIYNVVIKLQQ